MKITRRNVLSSSLFGAGYLGLRALATGLPAAVLARGAKAFADGATCLDKSKAQFVILHTSGLGDPINANVPGTYADPGIVHSADPLMAATPFSLGGQQVVAARPWSTLPQAVLDRTSFWHAMTNTSVHPKEPDVLQLNGATAPSEMLPSLLAKQLAPCLGTVQAQPITLGARSPSEGLSYSGQALPIIPPTALAATLSNPAGPVANLQALRDDTLTRLDALYRTTATKAQKAYLDSLLASQSEVRSIRQDLLGALSGIQDDSVASQITAAIVLIQMNVTPVIAIHIPFGGDNHSDPGLATETAQTVSGVAAIGSMMAQLAAAGLQDRVTFLSLNVFGRTLAAGPREGRQHNPNHQVSIAIGKAFKPGVLGGVAPVDGDYGATAIGDVAAVDTLAAFGKTALAAVGVDGKVIDQTIISGKVVSSALA